MSPLVRAQEIELEVGLAVLGTVVGGLTGYSYNVPLGATSGNVPGAVEAGIVGALMGYSLARTLFFTVRKQWISWGVIIAMVYLALWLGGLPAAVGGAVVGAGLVIAGVFGSEDDEEPESLPVRSVGGGGQAPGPGGEGIPEPRRRPARS
jgi:hypothetical protein